jgi:adenine-specific DNA-methyltransferase
LLGVLKEQGRIAMVIPAELLQVDYAAELRSFLSNHYSKITLITFKRLVFESIQQEVVLLLGERNGDTHTGIRTIELDGIEDLTSYEHTGFSTTELKPLDHSTEKWTRYFLDREEIELLREVAANPKLTLASDVIDVDVGIVTGLNEFFVLTEQQIRSYGLEPYTQRIVGRSGHLPGVIFTVADWQENARSNYPAYLLSLPDAPLSELPKAVQDYVLYGEARELHKGYKCRIRRHWYTVPSIWTPQAFMLRQIHAYPNMMYP